MTPEPNDWPMHPRFDERRAQAARLLAVVQAAQIRLKMPRLEAVFMADRLVVGECLGVRNKHFAMGRILGEFALGDWERTIRFVEGMR